MATNFTTRYVGSNLFDFFPGNLDVVFDIGIRIKFKSHISQLVFFQPFHQLLDKKHLWYGIQRFYSVIGPCDPPVSLFIPLYHNKKKVETFFFVDLCLHQASNVCQDTDYKEGDDDSDWRYFLLKQPHTSESKKQSHQTRNQ